MMRSLRVGTQIALLGAATWAVGQAPEPLPTALSGHWVVVLPNGRLYTDTMSVVLDAQSGTGAVTGRLTVRGVTCGAQDEPLTGTWDGAQLRFESRVRPNVNAQQKDAQCASGKVAYVLRRKPGQQAFDGEFTRDGMSVPGQATLAPSK